MSEQSEQREEEKEEYIKKRSNFMEKWVEIFQEFESAKESDDTYFTCILQQVPEKKLPIIAVIDKANVHLLKNIHVIDHPLFTDNIESRSKFINTVLDRMETFLEHWICKRPLFSFSNENQRDFIIDFKSRCLLVKHEFLLLKDKTY